MFSNIFKKTRESYFNAQLNWKKMNFENSKLKIIISFQFCLSLLICSIISQELIVSARSHWICFYGDIDILIKKQIKQLQVSFHWATEQLLKYFWELVHVSYL